MSVESPVRLLPDWPPIVTKVDLHAAIQRLAGGVTAWQLAYVTDASGRRLPPPPTRTRKRRRRR